MKTCGLVALGEGLGQLKWELLKKRNSLQHFATFDTASHGPWGCILLMAELRGRKLLPTLGAVVSILALAIDPFIQQLVSY